MVQPWRRNPHRLGERTDPAEELLRLACLTYGADGRERIQAATTLLAEQPELARANLYTAAATGSSVHLRQLLVEDPAAADRAGGPYDWPPLLYTCYSPTASGSRGLATGRFTDRDGRIIATVVQEGLVRLPRS